ncbi:unannotated protein [freshwater metagenome]|uniref:Unannotated protein n=1 Tax=freshwater metagenome TaxID=449393 RepID=A0A6J7J0A8_9ZZZZ|nr:mycofactocin biosynthesis chaperone MftB [Actinomycetota bacterium]MSW36346.1 mycofactocin biosynthesis chaperone MftB [Actinomycetota bacterium]
MAVPDVAVSLDEPWHLSPSVAIRPESFGALAYHFGNRRLTFLKRPELLAVVQGLDEAADVRTALANAGVPSDEWTAYVAALDSLASADMIRPRTGQDSAP